MGVRVWGVVEDRLIEVRAEPAGSEPKLRLIGLPASRTRPAVDRIRAALVNSAILTEAPSVTLRVEPPVGAVPTTDLDLPLALAALASTGAVGEGLRWILATGRLGLDGSVYSRGLEEPLTLTVVVESLCHTPGVGFERMFESDRE